MADFMFVQGLLFLITLLTNVNLITLEYLLEMESANIITGMGNAIQVYQNKGMESTTALVDPQFDTAQGLLGSTDLNVVGAKEHVSTIERKIRLIKESAVHFLSKDYSHA